MKKQIEMTIYIPYLFMYGGIEKCYKKLYLNVGISVKIIITIMQA